MERGEAWHIKDRSIMDDNTTTVSFQNNDGTMKITTIAYNNLICGHMIVIKHEDHNSQQFINMLTGGVKKDEQGNWVDEQNNATISFNRQPNGEQVCYKVMYKEFYN